MADPLGIIPTSAQVGQVPGAPIKPPAPGDTGGPSFKDVFDGEH